VIKDYLYNLATDKTRGLIAGVIKAFLFLLSLIYGLAVRALIALSRLKPYRLNCKVISVGNITLGGTGKTVLVEYIARYLKSQGHHKVAILSRGYKRKKPLPVTRYPLPETMGDEPYMLAKKLGDVPVIVDPDRIRAGLKAIKDYGADTLILDDGFQQWRIHKDLEIVCIDAVNPFGNRNMIPRGILREPLSALKRADVFILTKTNLSPNTQEIKDFLQCLNPSAQVFGAIHQPSGFCRIDKSDELLDPHALAKKTAALFCGIGAPASFENLIAGLDIKIGLSFKFPDHHHYTKEDLDKIMAASKEKNIDTIITTEKDAMRLLGLQLTAYDLQLLVLRIELKITQDENIFLDRLPRL